MLHNITINIQDILAKPDYSITDFETIRQIGLVTTKMHNGLTDDENNALCRKPKKELVYVALYPEVISSYNINNAKLQKVLTKKRKEHEFTYRNLNLDIDNFNDKYYQSYIKKFKI